jgi:hypothetical protein
MTTQGEDLGPTDRRQFARYAMSRSVAVRLACWASLEVLGQDISQGGIRLSLPCAVAAGEQVTVGLTLPNELQLSLEAEVRFVSAGSEPGGCVAGLRWIDSTSADVEMLSQVIADLQTIAV